MYFMGDRVDYYVLKNLWFSMSPCPITLHGKILVPYIYFERELISFSKADLLVV